jgi:hypothetical protein
MVAFVLHDHPLLYDRWLCAWDPEDDWFGVLGAKEEGIRASSEVEGVKGKKNHRGMDKAAARYRPQVGERSAGPVRAAGESRIPCSRAARPRISALHPLRQGLRP